MCDKCGYKEGEHQIIETITVFIDNAGNLGAHGSSPKAIDFKDFAESSCESVYAVCQTLAMAAKDYHDVALKKYFENDENLQKAKASVILAETTFDTTNAN